MAFKTKYLKPYNKTGAQNESDKLKIKQWKDLPKKAKRKTKKKKA